jgi:hypothetical protein
MIENWLAEALCIVAMAFIVVNIILHILKLIGED